MCITYQGQQILYYKSKFYFLDSYQIQFWLFKYISCAKGRYQSIDISKIGIKVGLTLTHKHRVVVILFLCWLFNSSIGIKEETLFEK